MEYNVAKMFGWFTTDVKLLYSKDPNGLMLAVADAIYSSSDEGKAAAKRLEKMVSAMTHVYEKAAKGSVELRVTRAFLVKGEAHVSMGGDSKTAAYHDYNKLADGQPIAKKKFSRSTYDTEALRNALIYMLSTRNVCTLSWGTRKHKISDDESVVLPCLIQRMSTVDIYESYVLHVPHPGGRVSRGSFYKIFGAVTSGNQKLLTSVDYVTGVLVNDAVSTLQTIVDDLSPDHATKEDLGHRLEIVKNFLKNQYDLHVHREDDVSTHGIAYGLGLPQQQAEVRKGRCNGCNFVNHYIHDLQNVIAASTKAPDVKNDTKASSRRCSEEVLSLLCTSCSSLQPKSRD